MYSRVQLGLKYFRYYLTASSSKGHGTHSPFVFDFITKVLNDKIDYDDYKKIEAVRRKMLKDRTVLTVDDYGAGSSSEKSHRRAVAAIARTAVKPKKYGQLLYRIVKYYQPNTLIELGTSLGVTSSYLKLANTSSDFYTLEGSPEIAKVAGKNFQTLEINNLSDQQKSVNLIEGNFDYTLPAVLYHLPTVDFAFVDGNHRRQSTENYFHWLLAKSNYKSIFVFDDIHWSRDMEQAWNNIKEHIAVRCSIDLFHFGIIFFRQEFKEKHHFRIRW
jgi:predicted O-methyltransferase YrrM